MAKLKLDPKRTALLIQDLQNDVMIDRGAWAETGAPEHAKEQKVVANVKRLVAARSSSDFSCVVDTRSGTIFAAAKVAQIRWP